MSTRPVLRLVLLALSLACVAAAFAADAWSGPRSHAWPLVAAGFVLAVLGTRAIPLEGTAITTPPEPASRRRRWFGVLLAVLGAASFAWASVALLEWQQNFDRGWLAWVGGVCFLGVGLDLSRGRWRAGPGMRDLRLWLLVAALLALGLGVRFGTFVLFPGESHVTQVEELQTGAMGAAYLGGWRQRWEYLSHAWLGALGLWSQGSSLMAMRAPFTLLSGLKVAVLFLWLRFAVGNAGAIAGSFLLAVSAWDVTSARVPTNQNTLVAALVFALLCGPARRSRPSAYVWLGFSSGYVLFEYVVYRALVVYALAGAWIASLRSRAASLAVRLALPLVSVAIPAVMGAVLYTYLTQNAMGYQYFDGWGRARSQSQYYNPDASWSQTLAVRGERALRSVNLFFFLGDESPVRNPFGRAMTDPVTTTLVLVGVAYGLSNPWRNAAGLAAFALLTTLAGTLVATGNFDPVRAGGAVVYFYGLAGYGAAAVLEALRRALGRLGRRLGYALLALALVAACADNLGFLWNFCTSPVIRRNQFRELAYLSDWLGRNVKSDDYVVAITPGFSYLFELNDATWMRGPDAKGATSWDVENGLGLLRKRRERTTLFVYAGAGTRAAKDYLQTLLPDVHFGVHTGQTSPDNDIAFGVVEHPPQDLDQRIEQSRCRYAEGKFRIYARDAEEPVFALEARLPFVDACTWPGAVQGNLYRLQERARAVEADIGGTFTVERGGEYVFGAEIFPGTGTLRIDGLERGSASRAVADLDPGPHRIEVHATFEPGSFPAARLLWSGPDTSDAPEILPFYRVGVCTP